MFINNDPLYLDIDDMRNRGWTDMLIKRYLGAPDRWDTVDHFRNFTGKRKWFLERVELAEAHPASPPGLLVSPCTGD